jgi:peroxiredoxin
MKQFKIFLLALAGLFFVSACNNNQNSNKYTIKVKLSGLKDNSVLVLQQRTDKGFEVVDTAKVVDDALVFTAPIDQPNLVYITSSAFRGAIPVFAEAGEIQVIGSLDSLAKTQVSGSKSHDFFVKINKSLANYDKIWQDFYFGPYRAMSKADQALNEDKINGLYDSAQNLKAHFLETELIKSGNEAATPVLTLSNIDAMDVDACQAIYDKLSPEVLKSGASKRLADRIAIIKRTAVGQKLIDFTMNDTLGNPVTLSEYAKGKYVLVDFWAAWCAPCRGENPNVVANYKKYHDKGFTVLGVSFDQKKENWEKAIHDDGLLWEQVSDLKGWNNAAGKLYGIQSIPQNILLSPEGIIIERNLRGSALSEKLAELFDK